MGGKKNRREEKGARGRVFEREVFLRKVYANAEYVVRTICTPVNVSVTRIRPYVWYSLQHFTTNATQMDSFWRHKPNVSFCTHVYFGSGTPAAAQGSSTLDPSAATRRRTEEVEEGEDDGEAAASGGRSSEEAGEAVEMRGDSSRTGTDVEGVWRVNLEKQVNTSLSIRGI